MISDRLKNTILKTLKLDEFDITDETLASQIPGFDSLSHFNVISAIKIEFSFRFTLSEVKKLINLGDPPISFAIFSIIEEQFLISELVNSNETNILFI